ncbi:MAG: RimK family alpha-L-glutamate ligase [Actinomycetota bacterium]|nr:RimK family alpha-L-glutamate ligase [Actinomycetota bacterium]MDD5600638.1 RimK family alpha-L-glutamate ligase [Actinomycetota bacterium]
MKKTKIWILGEKSKKTDFNFYTDSKINQIADEMNIELKLISPGKIDLIVSKEDIKNIMYDGNAIEVPDCVITRIGTITYYSLAIIRQLEKLGVFVLNSSHSIEIAKDKLFTLQLLSANNIPVPKTMLVKFPFNIALIEREFSYPVIVKTITGSGGKGVFLAENRNRLISLINRFASQEESKNNLILQEFISASRGKDIRVIVIGGRAIGAIMRRASDGNFKANYSAGGLVDPYIINPTVEWLAVESSKIIGLDIAGVDILFDKENYKVCEVNSYPGFAGFEKVTDINVSREIFKYILEYQEKKNNTTVKNTENLP